MSESVQSFYGNRLRTRACGICIDRGRLLLVSHRGLSAGDFWAPPGGEIALGESAAACVTREIREETGLPVIVGKFLFAAEFIRLPLHAIELFFEVTPVGSDIRTGTDPEAGSPTLITDVKYMAWDEIVSLPADQRHGLFKQVSNLPEILSLHGYFRI